MRSTDARDQAWGAFYAGRDVMPRMIRLLEQIVSTRIASAGLADTAALDSALDIAIAGLREDMIRRYAMLLPLDDPSPEA